MFQRTLRLVLLALPATLACRATPPVPARSGYTLVLIQTGPMSGKLSEADSGRAFAGHFSNMEHMAHERRLLVAGPFGEDRHDANLRGLFVLDTSDRATAEAWASTDPTTQAGVFVLEYHDLVTEVALEVALEADLARLAQQRAEGETPSPGDGARAYVLLIAEHGDLARRELDPLRTREGGVYVLADLDGNRGWAVLDAQNAAEARARFAPQLENLGAHTLDDWFASEQLAKLVGP